MAVTAAHIVGVNPVKSTGEVMTEIFTTSGISPTFNTNVQLESIAPNPFSSKTKIRYSISESSKIEINIRDFSGKLIKELVNRKETAGEKSVSWDGTNTLGQKVATGVYFYTLESYKNRISGKIVFLRDN
jgi:flagellar hook assembly protein FlgD